LCINVFRYLPKEKEETNLHVDAQGISAKRVMGKPRNKKGNKSKPLGGSLGRPTWNGK
jgi:hypothetical protein